jgi:outer membrane protein TolC
MAELIGGLFMPIFDAGRIDALVAKASADQQIAIASYKKTVRSAYREVEEALYNEKRLSERYRHASTMVREYKKAYDLTYKNYKIGQGTLLDVLDVQTKWINARILKTQILKERLVNRVNLHLALGGSFDKRVSHR